MSARGRPSSGAAASKSPSTRSAQSAAQAATRRRSASVSACGDATALPSPSALSTATDAAIGLDEGGKGGQVDAVEDFDTVLLAPNAKDVVVVAAATTMPLRLPRSAGRAEVRPLSMSLAIWK